MKLQNNFNDNLGASHLIYGNKVCVSVKMIKCISNLIMHPCESYQLKKIFIFIPRYVHTETLNLYTWNNIIWLPTVLEFLPPLWVLIGWVDDSYGEITLYVVRGHPVVWPTIGFIIRTSLHIRINVTTDLSPCLSTKTYTLHVTISVLI